MLRRLAALLVVGLLSLGITASAPAFLISGIGPSTTGLITDLTLANSSGSPLTNVPVVFGLMIARGDIPSCGTANTLILKDHASGLPLTWQMDDWSLWDDGSCRHLPISAFTGASTTIAAGGTFTIDVYKTAGAYVAGTDNRTSADITGSHAFQMQITDLRDHSNALIGSGAETEDVNTCFSDGTFDLVATGPVKRSYVLHCAPIDTTPVTTTLNIGGTLAAGTTGNVTVNTLPAGFPTSTTLNQIIKIGSEEILAKYVNATTLNLTKRGASRTVAASHADVSTVTHIDHRWMRHYFDIYTDPSNSANVYSIGHMPLVMQPWLNVVNPDFVHYQAKYVDGVSTIRDWAAQASVGVTQDATHIHTSGGSPANAIDLTGMTTLPKQSECVGVSSSGSLPTTSPQIAVNTPYWLMNISGSFYQLYPDGGGPSGNPNAGALITISNVGSGTLTVTRRICQSYRLAWYSAADDSGNENFTANATTMTALTPKLTTSEQQYWIKTGMIPPYDTSLIPNAYSNGSVPGDVDADVYRPLIAVATTNQIGVAGDPHGQGPLPEWNATTFMRQAGVSVALSAADYNVTRAAALGHMHMTWVGILAEETGYIKPLNNGSDRAGASYPSLLTPQPTWSYDQSNIFGITKPLSVGANSDISNPPLLAVGVWGITGGSGLGPSLGHWPLDPYFAWLTFGKRFFLDGVYFDGNIGPTVFPDTSAPGSKTVRPNGVGTSWYGKLIFGRDARSPAIFKDVTAAAVLGSASNPERAYYTDIYQQNLLFWSTVVNQAGNSGQDTIGAFDVATNGGDGLTTWWGGFAHIFGKAMTRDTGFDTILTRLANGFRGRWDDTTSGVSSFFMGPFEYSSNLKYGSDVLIPNSSNGSFITKFATSFADIGYSVCGPSAGAGTWVNFVGGGSTTVNFPGLYTGFNFQEGDMFKNLSPAYCGGAPNTYNGPIEVKPNDASSACPGQDWFFIKAPSASSGSVTAQLSCTAGGAAIVINTVGASLSSNAYVIRSIATPATSLGVVNNSSWNGSGVSGGGKNYLPLNLGEMNWMKSIGVTGLDTAIANATARSKITTPMYQANPKYDMTYQPVQ